MIAEILKSQKEDQIIIRRNLQVIRAKSQKGRKQNMKVRKVKAKCKCANN